MANLPNTKQAAICACMQDIPAEAAMIFSELIPELTQDEEEMKIHTDTILVGKSQSEQLRNSAINSVADSENVIVFIGDEFGPTNTDKESAQMEQTLGTAEFYKKLIEQAKSSNMKNCYFYFRNPEKSPSRNITEEIKLAAKKLQNKMQFDIPDIDQEYNGEGEWSRDFYQLFRENFPDRVRLYSMDPSRMDQCLKDLKDQMLLDLRSDCNESIKLSQEMNSYVVDCLSDWSYVPGFAVASYRYANLLLSEGKPEEAKKMALNSLAYKALTSMLKKNGVTSFSGEPLLYLDELNDLLENIYTLLGDQYFIDFDKRKATEIATKLMHMRNGGGPVLKPAGVKFTIRDEEGRILYHEEHTTDEEDKDEDDEDE